VATAEVVASGQEGRVVVETKAAARAVVAPAVVVVMVAVVKVRAGQQQLARWCC